MAGWEKESEGQERRSELGGRGISVPKVSLLEGLEDGGSLVGKLFQHMGTRRKGVGAVLDHGGGQRDTGIESLGAEVGQHGVGAPAT